MEFIARAKRFAVSRSSFSFGDVPSVVLLVLTRRNVCTHISVTSLVWLPRRKTFLDSGCETSKMYKGLLFTLVVSIFLENGKKKRLAQLICWSTERRSKYICIDGGKKEERRKKRQRTWYNSKCTARNRKESFWWCICLLFVIFDMICSCRYEKSYIPLFEMIGLFE